LIGDDDPAPSRSGETAQPQGRSGYQFDEFGIGEIVPLHDDRPVAIQENEPTRATDWIFRPHTGIVTLGLKWGPGHWEEEAFPYIFGSYCALTAAMFTIERFLTAVPVTFRRPGDFPPSAYLRSPDVSGTANKR